MIFLLPFSSMGQEDNPKRSLFSFNAGVSIPIMCFASDNYDNPAAGYARPGFTLDIFYAYRFWENLGVAGSIFFSDNKIKTGMVQAPGKPGYKYYGLLIGPMLSKDFSSRWAGDLRFLTGISRVHTPKITYAETNLMNADEIFAFTWTAGAGIRYNLSENSFLAFRTDHTQLKPQLNSEGARKTEQHIIVINLGAGMAIKW